MSAGIRKIMITLFAKRARSRLRNVMRGYRLLRQAGRLNAIAKVKDTLKNAHLNINADTSSKKIFGEAVPQAELIVRQYLLARRGDIQLAQTLQCSIANPTNSLVVALPKEWQQVIIDEGFSISPIRSNLAWWGYVVAYFFFGVALFLKHGAASFKQITQNKRLPTGKYIYFDNLIPNALPRETLDGESHDVVSWYCKWVGSTKGIDAFCHNVKTAPPTYIKNTPVFSIDRPIIPLSHLRPLLKFFIWGMIAIAKALMDLLRGRWAHAIMLGEAVKAAQIRFQSKDLLAQTYLFHNSSCIYRPLWTYDAEQRGAQISLYFYSTNCEPFKRSEGYAKYSNSYYELMNWPHYIVWDEYQADFIKRTVRDVARIDLAGPIWFSSSDEILPSLPSPALAVFDVQPVRNSLYQSLGIDFDYYNPTNATLFLADCYTATQACQAYMALKRKREIGSLIHPRYGSLLEKLTKQAGFIPIDSNTSAIQLIEKCAAVISMPFTSTALIGRAQGKPSAYYDPYGMIQKDDRGAHGIPILHGLKELTTWLTDVLKQTHAKIENNQSAYSAG